MIETVGLAVAKTGGSKLALAAYKRAHPNDWQRRLTRLVVGGLDGVPKRRLGAWLHGSDAANLLDAAVAANGSGELDPRLRESLRASFEKSRRWRKHSLGRQRAIEDAALAAMLRHLLQALDPSAAVALSDKRQTQKLRTLSRDVAIVDSKVTQLGESQSLLTTAHRSAAFEQRLLSLPAPVRPMLRILDERDPTNVFTLVNSLTDPASDPCQQLHSWRETPPPWASDSNHLVLAAIGLVSEQYLLHEQAIHWYEAAANSGAPRRDYWLARAGLIALMLARGGDGDDPTKLQAAVRLAACIGAANDAEPMVQLLRAGIDRDQAACMAALSRWQPQDPMDVSMAALEAVTALLSGDRHSDGFWDNAIDHLKASLDVDWQPEVGLVLARLLNARAGQGKTTQRVADLHDAAQIAVRARDDFRLARQPSVVPLVEAVHAAGLDSDTRRVLALATSWPDYQGEATESEASHPRIVSLALEAAVQRGEQERMRSQVEALKPGYDRSAGLAYLQTDSTAVGSTTTQRLWEEALADATTTEQRLRAWHELARLGDTNLLGLREELGESMPSLVARLAAMAASASGLPDSAIQMLLPQRREDVVAARLLVAAYESVGQFDDAVATLLDAATDFHDPELALEAAYLLVRMGDTKRAEQVSDDLMTDSFSKTGQVMLLALRGDLFARRSDMRRADEALGKALVIEPGNVSARWGRVMVLVVRGKASEAWDCLNSHPGGRPVPRDEQDARAFLEAALHGDAPVEVFVTEGLDLLERFPDSEGLAASFLLNAMVAEGPLPELIRERLGTVLEWFVTKWPDSTAMRRVNVPTDDPDELRRMLDRMSQPATERAAVLEDIARQVSEGGLPLSMLSFATGRPYSEMVVSRPVGVLVAEGPPDDHQLSTADALRSLGHEVVCDLTAVHVAAEVVMAHSELAAVLAASHRAFCTTDDSIRDAKAGADALGRRSPGVWVPGSDANPGHFQAFSEAVVNQNAEQGHRLFARAKSLQAMSAPKDGGPFDFELLQDMHAWGSVVLLAHARGAALWCDDLPTRQLARGAGIPTFSTRSLVAALIDRGQLAEPARRAIDRTLIDLRVGDLPFDPSLLMELVQHAEWACAAAGQAWARPHSWLQTGTALAEFAEVLRAVATNGPDLLADWCFVGTLGAASVHYGLGPVVGQDVAARILALTVHLVMDNPTEVARCVQASRLAVERSPLSVADPLPNTVRLLRNSMASLLPSASVVPYLTGVFSAAPDGVQRVVRLALLT